jgi:hypothetical protein
MSDRCRCEILLHQGFQDRIQIGFPALHGIDDPVAGQGGHVAAPAVAEGQIFTGAAGVVFPQIEAIGLPVILHAG